jgi:glucose-6-phosphate 1-dehydrogenase
MVLRNTSGEFIAGRILPAPDMPPQRLKIEPFTMIIFGATGDLSKRKLLPALFRLYQEKELEQGFSILGIARSAMSDEQYRRLIREAIQASIGTGFDDKKWEEFSRHLFYFSGVLEEKGIYEKLCGQVDRISPPEAGGREGIIYYLALPPEVTPLVVENLKNYGLCRGIWLSKIIVEKPFGRDLSSAGRLNQILTRAFTEDQIYRIDHYLGKETVQNIIFFRFANSIFEYLWNRRYIDNIQITVAEDLGIENRASFYEQAGVIRDIVQNHILQLVALVAMEPPIGFTADFIRDERVKVFRSIQPLEPEDIGRFTVRGQYSAGRVRGKDVPGYREEGGVAADSSTPTFFAAKFYIANWRWAGVPFYIRTGKRMPRRLTEIAVEFNQPPLQLFRRACGGLEPNVLVLSIQPEEKISLRFGVKYPYASDQICSIDMVFRYQETFRSTPLPPYERLLMDCMRGDLTLFVRQDGIEAMWNVVDPIISHWEKTPPHDFPNYAAGTWGPAEAHRLLEREGRRWTTT